MVVKGKQGKEYEILESANEYYLLRALAEEEDYKPYVVAYRLDEVNGGWESADVYDDFEQAKRLLMEKRIHRKHKNNLPLFL